jgi:Chaperone of endosialidase
MTITHQIVSNPALPIAPGGDVVSQLSGMLGQANALANAGVGLPGLQAIGSQIAGMGSSIIGAGGTSGISSAITSLGSQMASATSIGAMSGLLTSLTTQLSGLSSLLNPSGLQANILHSHILDSAGGITHSAFQGQHTVNLGGGGINLTSATKVAHTAPTLPHNGLTMVSDALQVTKQITGSAFGMLSDRRLKTNINDHPSVLEQVMALKLKTFDVKTVDWESEEEHGSDARASLGLIAQEVQEIFPLVVHGDKFLSIEESKIGLLLLAAFQEFVLEVRAEIAEMKKP